MPAPARPTPDQPTPDRPTSARRTLARPTLARIAIGGAVGFVLLAGFAAGIAAAAEKAKERAKATLGRLEYVAIREAGIVMAGKIDTGTQSSSLHATDIVLFRSGGQEMVRFTIADMDARPVTLERPLVRLAKFKDNGRNSPQRPVVTLGLCVGKLYRVTQVNLTDRGRFAYPLLLGRRFLFGHAVVDTAKKYTAEPACKQVAAKD